MKRIIILKTLIICSIFAILTGCAGLKPNIAIPTFPPTPKKINHPIQVALVLGAGGARGYAHIGVLKVLHNAGVPVNMIAGASAGSIIGALYADNLNPNKVQAIMMRAGFWDFADIANAPSLSGLVEGYHLQKFLLDNMHARYFRQLKIPFMAASADIRTDKTVILRSGPIAPAVQASAAVPGLVQPVHLYGHILIDGGGIDPIPVDLVKPYHPKIIIAVNIAEQLPKRLPITASGIYDRHVMMSWLKLSKYSAMGANVVIRPKVGDVGTFDLSHKKQLIYAGEVAAKKALPHILQLLKDKHIALVSHPH